LQKAAAGSISRDEPTNRAKKGLARHPIPVILLAPLAINAMLRGMGFGSALLKNALLRAAQAADTIGARALLVHAQDDQAKGFYEHLSSSRAPATRTICCLSLKT
jgi:GNAT superfamily N-acetyltransferase